MFNYIAKLFNLFRPTSTASQPLKLDILLLELRTEKAEIEAIEKYLGDNPHGNEELLELSSDLEKHYHNCIELGEKALEKNDWKSADEGYTLARSTAQKLLIDDETTVYKNASWKDVFDEKNQKKYRRWRIEAEFGIENATKKQKEQQAIDQTLKDYEAKLDKERKKYGGAANLWLFFAVIFFGTLLTILERYALGEEQKNLSDIWIHYAQTLPFSVILLVLATFSVTQYKRNKHLEIVREQTITSIQGYSRLIIYMGIENLTQKQQQTADTVLGWVLERSPTGYSTVKEEHSEDK